jgi:hypothetical protein
VASDVELVVATKVVDIDGWSTGTSGNAPALGPQSQQEKAVGW